MPFSQYDAVVYAETIEEVKSLESRPSGISTASMEEIEAKAGDFRRVSNRGGVILRLTYSKNTAQYSKN